MSPSSLSVFPQLRSSAAELCDPANPGNTNLRFPDRRVQHRRVRGSFHFSGTRFPTGSGSNLKIRFYERKNFGDQIMKFSEDCQHVYEQFRYSDIYFCNGHDGHWVFYEEPTYKGYQYYRRLGASRDRVTGKPQIPEFVLSEESVIIIELPRM
ncbi:hypothetical protein NDU88_003571 [Pleurodeles waltl]|uniref:Beta/gamma crystallin 'Greek key' domain-containing protein n=1 Tax=Pleurodeles waltl TaxID=8319 RepID=A0AAV7UER4_PLEWA|nr:hypothetical protein NDU88_003571 [Pleurodeles waltl]